MELSKIEKILLYGLSLTPLSREEIYPIPLFLRTEENMELMIMWLKRHPQATAQEVLNAVGTIIKHSKKQMIFSADEEEYYE